jgi:tRNA threonylcarbamoyladenosine biosynthesis protein TsaE
VIQSINERCWLTCGAEQTQALGFALGRSAQAGDFIACRGVLGAGKTTFIQGFALGLGVSSDAYVRSPTFMLVNEYEGRCPLYHFDFYRLQDANEVLDIGFDDYCLGDGVIIVEWADKFPELLPEKRLDLSIEIASNDQRTICAIACGHTYSRYIDHTAQELGA